MYKFTPLKEVYQSLQTLDFGKEIGVDNVMALPRLKKITLNIGCGRQAVRDKSVIEKAMRDLTLIAGQKAVERNARISEAGFKLRAGMPIGCKVTLRRDSMFNFLERLVHVVLPRVSDFQAFSPKSFDRQGNISFGLSEQLVFPEIEYGSIDATRGLDICLTLSSQSPQHSLALLKRLHIPFRDS